MLYQTREAAVTVKKGFAENLSNIAHQIKTPITAISLCAQMMEIHPSQDYLAQVHKQLGRLTHLEEALLLLSRLDAGTLPLKTEAVDVYTVVSLAADNLQEMFDAAGLSVDIPEMGEMEIMADLDWTMEALMNLFKNCAEYTPPGERSIAPVPKTRFTRKSSYGMKVKDLIRKISPICLNGFTEGRMRRTMEPASASPFPGKSLNARMAQSGPSINQAEAEPLKSGFTVTKQSLWPVIMKAKLI